MPPRQRFGVWFFLKQTFKNLWTLPLSKICWILQTLAKSRNPRQDKILWNKFKRHGNTWLCCYSRYGPWMSVCEVIEMLPHLGIVHFTFDSDALILWNCWGFRYWWWWGWRIWWWRWGWWWWCWGWGWSERVRFGGVLVGLKVNEFIVFLYPPLTPTFFCKPGWRNRAKRTCEAGSCFRSDVHRKGLCEEGKEFLS